MSDEEEVANFLRTAPRYSGWVRAKAPQHHGGTFYKAGQSFQIKDEILFDDDPFEAVEIASTEFVNREAVHTFRPIPALVHPALRRHLPEHRLHAGHRRPENPPRDPLPWDPEKAEPLRP